MNMPNINNIAKTMKMKKINIPKDILAQLGFDEDFKLDTEDYESFVKQEFDLLVKINDLLTIEQKYAVMEQQGCCKGGQRHKESKDFGKKYANKSLDEKLKILSAGNNAPCMNEDGTMCYAMPADADAPCMNNDGTISYAVSCYIFNTANVLQSCMCIERNYEKGYNTLFKEQPDKAFSFLQLICGCCAGHHKHHLQNRLNIKLKLKSINVSSVKTDKGFKRVFIYEIVD
jgi:hypothetical protein